MDILVKFDIKEIDKLIEMLSTHTNDLDEDGIKLYNDLQTIRSNKEAEYQEWLDRKDYQPNEDQREFSANPTSAEHVK